MISHDKLGTDSSPHILEGVIASRAETVGGVQVVCLPAESGTSLTPRPSRSFGQRVEARFGSGVSSETRASSQSPAPFDVLRKRACSPVAWGDLAEHPRLHLVLASAGSFSRSNPPQHRPLSFALPGQPLHPPAPISTPVALSRAVVLVLPQDRKFFFQHE